MTKAVAMKESADQLNNIKFQSGMWHGILGFMALSMYLYNLVFHASSYMLRAINYTNQGGGMVT